MVCLNLLACFKLYLMAGRATIPSTHLLFIRNSILLVYGGAYALMTVGYLYLWFDGQAFPLYWLRSACVCSVIVVVTAILLGLGWNRSTGLFCLVSWNMLLFIAYFNILYRSFMLYQRYGRLDYPFIIYIGVVILVTKVVTETQIDRLFR